jgi:hypothetical protein
MIFLGVSEQTRKALSRTLTRAFQRSHPDDRDVFCLLIGAVLVAIGIYLVYKWLSTSEPQENPAPERTDSTSSEHAIFAVVFLGLGAFFLILGTPANPTSKENLPGTVKVRALSARDLLNRDQAKKLMVAEIDAAVARLRDKQGQAFEAFDAGSLKLRRPKAYQLPKLSESSGMATWPYQLKLPKLAKRMPTEAPWAQRPQLIHTPKNLVEVDIFYHLEYISYLSKLRKAQQAKSAEVDGAAPEKDGVKPNGK